MNRRNFLQNGALAGTTAIGLVQAPSMSSNSMPFARIRIARPTDKLEQVVTFYRDALGLPIIGHFDHHAGYSGVMLGMPDDRIHLEFTHADQGSPCPAPTKDNLLVLYMPTHEAYMSALGRMESYGHSPVAPENPYWREKSYTFEDPDGWRIVLYDGEPFGNG